MNCTVTDSRNRFTATNYSFSSFLKLNIHLKSDRLHYCFAILTPLNIVTILLDSRIVQDVIRRRLVLQFGWWPLDFSVLCYYLEVASWK